MGYVVANSKTEAKEILEQEYDPVGLHVNGFSYTVLAHKEYEISKINNKITKKDLEQWNERLEFINESR